jgi:hypothetical protein
MLELTFELLIQIKSQERAYFRASFLDKVPI